MFKMKVSAGILFIKNKKILLAHVTGQKNWDIPKGQVDEDDEDHEAAAIRECYEEIGFEVKSKEDLMPLGVLEYNKSKQLSLFLYVGKEYPNEAQCKCSSFFIDKGMKVYDNDDFEYIPLDKISEYCVDNMVKTLRKAIDNYYPEPVVDTRDSKISNKWNPNKYK